MMITPLKHVRLVADKLVRDTPFRYRLEPARVNHDFHNETCHGMQVVDFGRTFGLGRPALAYAWTQLNTASSQTIIAQVEHNDGCKIWLNGEVIYEKTGDRKIQLKYEERSIEMSGLVVLKLKTGANTLLVKSETAGSEWRFHLQPPSLKGAVVNSTSAPVQIGLMRVADVDPQIAGLSNWLVVGPFENRDRDLSRVHPPEYEFLFGKMYPGLNSAVTWTIPKVEVLGAIIDWQPWGSLYHWAYYNGGTAWAMQALAQATGEAQYLGYANRFCDFHLNGIPFVEHQLKTLNATDSANHFIIDSPLLDFTLAPSLPYIERLRTETAFAGREQYEQWIEKMLTYAQVGQIRLPGLENYTRNTPVQYTTWTDDMFMGIPFLIQAALYAKDEAARNVYFDDAARQILAFNTQVWDPQANLYCHVRYSQDERKFPHWSRANGWGIWAMSEVLLHLPETHPHREAILTHFQTHAASLARLQGVDGFWPNVLDHPDGRIEISGTAIFTLCLARGINHGWLKGRTFVEAAYRGWRAIDSQIEPDGTVHNICEGTMCSADVEFYGQRAFYDNDTHGLFPILFAGIEMEKLLVEFGEGAVAPRLNEPFPQGEPRLGR